MKLFIKLLLEFLPLILLFVFTALYDIYVGTAVLMIATVISMVVVWVVFHKFAWMALINAATALLSGALTLWLVDPAYVKMKPTIVSVIYGAILFIGLGFGKSLLKPLVGLDVHLTDEGWHLITRRWGFYFLFVAVLNEAIWRTQTDLFWAGFKVFGLLPFTILFAIAQLPLLRDHRTPGAPLEPFLERLAILLGSKQHPPATSAKPVPVATEVDATGKG